LITRLDETLREGKVREMVEAAVGLVGLGPGLTPSGDDFLVGLLAGLEAIGHPARATIAAAVAGVAPSRTTPIGAWVLRHAARGSFPERLHDALIALARGDEAAIRDAIERAMAYGATSGADTLVGLFAGLDGAAEAGGEETVAA
jgi:hypothetical protein